MKLPTNYMYKQMSDVKFWLLYITTWGYLAVCWQMIGSKEKYLKPFNCVPHPKKSSVLFKILQLVSFMCDHNHYCLKRFLLKQNKYLMFWLYNIKSRKLLI